jgi:hypothetical protein
LTLSLLLAFERAKVEMDRVGREAEMGAAAGVFSGEKDMAMDEAEGALLCEEWAEAALRSEVLRVLRNCRPRSPTVLEMLCREGCLRFLCGVWGASCWPGDWLGDWLDWLAWLG